MFRTNILLALCLFISLHAGAQGKHDNIWLFGYGSNNPSNHFGGTMINFSGGEPEATFFPLPPEFDFHVSCSFSDGDGRLRLYANGYKLVNGDHEVIENGDGLGTGTLRDYFCKQSPYYATAHQSMLFLPRPGHADRSYYLHSMHDYALKTMYLLYTEIELNRIRAAMTAISCRQRVFRGLL